MNKKLENKLFLAINLIIYIHLIIRDKIYCNSNYLFFNVNWFDANLICNGVFYTF